MGAALAILVPCEAVAARGSARDTVVSYLATSIRGGGVFVEWRTFHPRSRADTLVRTFAGHEPSGIYWDTTESRVAYIESGALFEMRWELQAQPWPVLRLPVTSGLSDWWFDPDSLRWQLAVVDGVPRIWARGEAPFTRCHSDLWQSDPAGAAWRIVQTDTADCGGCYACGTWSVPAAGAIRRRPMIGLDRQASAMTIDGWGGPLEAIPPPRGESATRFAWYFIPCRSVPGKGLALRLGDPGPDGRHFMGPLYLMDRRRGTQQVLETPGLYRDQEMWRVGMAEHAGFLLVNGIRTYVFDLRTGEQLFRPRGIAKGNALWVAGPAPASIDRAGLRRLRTRFR